LADEVLSFIERTSELEEADRRAEAAVDEGMADGAAPTTQ
jgi:hypothetical protein